MRSLSSCMDYVPSIVSTAACDFDVFEGNVGDRLAKFNTSEVDPMWTLPEILTQSDVASKIGGASNLLLDRYTQELSTDQRDSHDSRLLSFLLAAGSFWCENSLRNGLIA